MMTKTYHHYTECGLDYVYLVNGFNVTETAYGPAVHVENAAELDRQIALALVNGQGPMTGQEVRFLRGMLDLTQGELAEMLGKDAQSVARWEKSKTVVPSTEDRALRQIYLEETGHKVRFIETVKRVSKIKERMTRVEVREDAKHRWKPELSREPVELCYA